MFATLQKQIYPIQLEEFKMSKKYKTTPKEKMIINLMEEVINILSTCEDLSDPEFSMYETMKHAVDTEVYYPLYDK